MSCTTGSEIFTPTFLSPNSQTQNMTGSIVCHMQDFLPSKSNEWTRDSLQEKSRVLQTARMSVILWCTQLVYEVCMTEWSLTNAHSDRSIHLVLFQTGLIPQSPVVSDSVRGVDSLVSFLSAWIPVVSPLCQFVRDVCRHWISWKFCFHHTSVICLSMMWVVSINPFVRG